jgi:UrcA family protein
MIAPESMFPRENFMNLLMTFPTRALMTAILATVSYSTLASTAAEEGSVSVKVQYGDLNLSAPAGVDTLKRRVSSAAEQVCGDQYNTDPFHRIQQNDCVRRATDDALARVNWPVK